MNVSRGNHQDRLLWGVGKRVNFIAPTDSQSTPAEQEKRDVRPERSSNFKEPSWAQLPLRQPQVPHQSRGSVARASSQPTSGGDSFCQLDFHAIADFQFALQLFDGSVNQIFLRGLTGKRLVPLYLEVYSPVLCATQS